MKPNSFKADHKLIQVLEKRSRPVSCSEHCILFKQGETPRGLYILESGEAVLTLESASGNTVMCVRAGADSLLGLPGIIGNEPYTMTAMARKGSEVRVVTRADFEDVIRMEPSLGLLVLQVLAVEVRSVRQALSEV